MIFDSWFGLIRILLIGVLAYVALIISLRISGKRTLSKWNAFDFVITIALGSTLATVILSKDVPLLEGILAFVLLVALQYLITWLSVRSSRIQDLVKAQPTLLFAEGDFCREAMKKQRVTEREIRAAARGHGQGSLEEVSAIVLETDGSFSVISRAQYGSGSALQDVSKK